MTLPRNRRPEAGASPRLAGAARVAAAAAGVALAGLALAPSPARPTLVVGSALFLLAAAAGSWLSRRYGLIAVAALNTLLIMVALEVVAAGAVALSGIPPVRAILARFVGPAHDLESHYLSLPHYGDEPWVPAYWKEHRRAVHQRYEPYVVWRTPAFSGEFIRVDSLGRRFVPDARCEAGAYRVFAFGGSGMWGWGTPDWETIPAHLQARLQKLRSEPVCVVNMGENAWVGFQGLIALETALLEDDPPDAAVFYDGVNEVLAALQNGRPLVHQNLPEIANRFEAGESFLLRWFKERHAVAVGTRALEWLGVGSGAGWSPTAPPESLGRETAAAYLHLVDQVSALGEEYGFEALFFWQPHILVGGKPLTPEEAEMITSLDWLFPVTEHARRLFSATYAAIDSAALTRPQLHYGGTVFDSVAVPVWIDTWGHLTPRGNDRVARWMLEEIAAKR